MRSLLAVAALALIVAPGCGDDTSNAVDMTAVADMSMPVDMAQITTCAGALQCVANCGMNTACQTDCLNRTSTQAGATLLALNDCLIMQCTMTDGGTPACASATDKSTTCQMCEKAAAQAAAGGGACSAELANCFSH